MSRPTNVQYTKDHEWIRIEDDGTVVVGITDHAVEQLTDITHIDLPEVGDTFKKGDSFAEIDSVKTVAEIYAPVTGEVVAVNKEFSENENYDMLNKEPFEGGWLVKFKGDNSTMGASLDAAGYEAFVKEEG